MLVLSRKEMQTILIGENVTLHIVAIDGGRVRIGIDAPSDVKILRGELKSGTHDKDSSGRNDQLSGRG
jgi:carbon storage regulator